MNYVILLTATIRPFGILEPKGRNDAFEREKDYFKAVRFYLEKGYRIVFVENSDTKSELIINLKNQFDTLEYLTFSSKDSALGKSHGEVEIFQYAMENSKFLNEIDYLIKITGRYIIKNIDDVVWPTDYVCKEVYINPTRNLKWADSRLMLMRKSYYTNYFLPAIEKYLDESKKVYMEYALMKSVLLYLLDGGELNLWPAYPAYDAYDGTHNEKISFGLFKRIKYNLYYKFKKIVFRYRV
jgi:hypothetical protein